MLQGYNGVGKSNVIEAISVLSNLKSFRTVSDTEIIKWGESSYYCCSTVKDIESRKFEVGCAVVSDRLKKRAKIDDIEMKKASEYYGNLLTVIFSPSDLGLLDGSPERRRRYFDGVISKVDESYFDEIITFRKVLHSRNKVLKDIREQNASINDLDIWDDMFARSSSSIMQRRREFIGTFCPLFEHSYNFISDVEDAPSVDYYTETGSDEVEGINELLRNLRKEDVRRSVTSIGPQRDNFVFMNKTGRNFQDYGSQGEKRTAAIALKISELHFVEGERNKRAIILLDDVLAELDEMRREKVIDFLTGGNQVILSMAHEGYDGELERWKQKRFIIEYGGVVREI